MRLRERLRQNVFSIVTLNVTCPSVSAGIERVEVDNSLDGSFIRDLNTAAGI